MYSSIKMALGLLSLFLLPLCSSAQTNQHSGSSGEERRATFRKMQNRYTGMPLAEFSAKGLDGTMINNRSLSGKVSLILIWYPGISSSNAKYNLDYLEIDTLAELRNKYKDFQIISLLADSMGLQQALADNPLVTPFRVGVLGTHQTARELVMGNGMPSCVLVDKNGLIARTSWMRSMLDQAAMADKIKDLMMP